MHLCPVNASPNFGKAAYGTAEVSVQGAVPALLAGQVAGALFGPSWLASDGSDILYQNGGTGSGPWILQTYDVDTPALTTEDADGQNFLAAGGGVWAAYLAGSGVRSNVVIASPTAPLSGAGVLDVSADGNIVLVDYVASAVGITVYDSSGTSIYSQPTTQLTNPIVRLVGNILSYCDGTGWHLRDITTGNAPNWCPPAGTPAVNWLIPITMADGSLWVVERTEVLRVREGFRNQAYVIESAPIGFNPDALAFSAGVMRIGYCTDEGESTASATLVDLTLSSGAQSIGVVSGGAIVFSAGPDLDYVTVEVGPNESTGGANTLNPPFPSQMLDKQSRCPVPSPWAGFFSGIGGTVMALERRAIPVPSAQQPGFGVVDPDTTGQVSIAATQPNDTLIVESGDNSISRATNPFTKALDLRVNPFALSGLGPRGMPGMDGDDGWPGPPGQAGATGPEGPAGADGAGAEIGLTRQTGDGAEDTFPLVDVASLLIQASVDGLVTDPLVYTLSGDGTEVTFDTAPGMGEVIVFQYVIETV